MEGAASVPTTSFGCRRRPGGTRFQFSPGARASSACYAASLLEHAPVGMTNFQVSFLLPSSNILQLGLLLLPSSCQVPNFRFVSWSGADNPRQNAPRPAAPVVLGLPPPPEPHHQPPPPVGAPLPVGAGLQQLEDQPAVAAESPKMGECDEGKEKEKTFENENGNRSSGAFGATAGNPAAGSTPIVNLPPLGHQQPGVNSFRGGHGFQFQLQPSAAGNSPLQLQRNPRQNARPFEPVLKQATISSVVCLVCGLPFGSCACWDDQFLDNPAAPVVGAGVLHLGGDATQLKHLVPPVNQPGPSNEGLKCSACRYHPVRLTAQPRRHICVCASCRSGGIFCSVCNFGP